MMGLLEIAEAFETIPREGTETDVPEGSRFIIISSTLADHIAASIRHALTPSPSFDEIVHKKIVDGGLDV